MKLVTIFGSFALLFSVFTLTACAPDLSPDNYNYSQNFGEAQNVVRGTVVSLRPVRVGNNTGTGAVAGGLAGAAAGSAIGEGMRSGIIGGVAGALAGGLLGNVIEKSFSRQMAIEYIIRTTRGHLISVVQGGYPLSVGEHVMVILGSPSRVIPA